MTTRIVVDFQSNSFTVLHDPGSGALEVTSPLSTALRTVLQQAAAEAVTMHLFPDFQAPQGPHSGAPSLAWKPAPKQSPRPGLEPFTDDAGDEPVDDWENVAQAEFQALLDAADLPVDIEMIRNADDSFAVKGFWNGRSAGAVLTFEQWLSDGGTVEPFFQHVLSLLQEGGDE